MLRWFYTVLNIKHQYQKVQFSTFLLKNPTYTLCIVIKISASMDWDAFSVQLKNHENFFSKDEFLIKFIFLKKEAIFDYFWLPRMME